MWNDVETTSDLLNFSVLAKTAAELIRESDSEPLSIGVSGSWGMGKSSLVKMIGETLKAESETAEKYVFTEFNAWLYQGYEDARMALLQSIGDLLLEEAKKRETAVDKVTKFIKRINWLKIGKLAAPTATGAIVGGTIGGPVGAVIGAVHNIIQKGDSISDDDFLALSKAYGEVQPDLKEALLTSKEQSSPKEINELRTLFEEILKELDIRLVVLVDDLDRCLPDTAISTLEAMRLLLFLPHTAFIIAADEEMIRQAVRHHFGGINISDDLVTSYFDKLIQIPLRVPRLGITEVKGYLILLLADLELRRGNISHEVHLAAKKAILSKVKKSWSGGLTHKAMKDAFGEKKYDMEQLVNLANEIAHILTTSDRIAGNPRLIKRFLNDLSIRQTIAKAEEINLPLDAMVKLQLFERCASPAAFEFLSQKTVESDDGKLEFLEKIETNLADDQEYELPDNSWDSSFIKTWLKIAPKLGKVDLRPLLYLSRNQTHASVSYDRLSPEAQEVLANLYDCKKVDPVIIRQIQHLGEAEAERLQTRVATRARSEGLDLASLKRALNIPDAFPNLAPGFISLLREIPPNKRPVPIIPILQSRSWCQAILSEWSDDSKTPNRVKTAITS